ncbi:MAG TPA: prepilin-type N-terminal cleavage/methylation domain-containing protein [Candidatus Angelobacter sp.]|nr:prepilin-type N-terminal cleavage/methylation domain-containing protein [Candidatus Angelobacter sp.]
MKARKNHSTGFTLLESLVAVVLILIVVGAIFDQMGKAQTGYKVEGQKVDLTQQQRQFIDQFTRDVRQAGYPGPFTTGLVPPVSLSDTKISAGITSISPNSLTLEGDLDNSGTVSVVTYSYNSSTTFPCPCIQRTVVPKAGGTPATYIEVQNVLDPGPQGIFTPYKVDGGSLSGLNLTLPAGATTQDGTYAQLQQIKSVGVTVTLQGQGNDMNGSTPIQVTMRGMARVPND